jgi:hypothetical protein
MPETGHDRIDLLFRPSVIELSFSVNFLFLVNSHVTFLIPFNWENNH